MLINNNTADEDGEVKISIQEDAVETSRHKNIFATSGRHYKVAHKMFMSFHTPATRYC